MTFLILSILSSCSIFITFKLLGKYKVPIFPVIITNYITASLTGYFLKEKDFHFHEIISADWFYTSIIIGILFITMFYLIGLSTQKAGLTITSISTKMSVVFPMLFSIIYYSEAIYPIKILGMFLALVSIFLATIRNKEKNAGKRNFFFPLILFLGMGFVDSTVKFNQEEYLQNTGVIESTTVIFLVSAIIGLFIQLSFNLKKIKEIRLSTALFGSLLGLSNFGSLYFLILALNSNFVDSSIIFAINNTSIILISVLIGRYFFKEKLSRLNWLGVAISVVAIISLSI